MNNVSIRLTLFGTISITLLFLLISGFYSLYSIRQLNKSLETVYNDRVVPLEQLKNIVDLYAVKIVDASNKVYHGIFTWEQGYKEIEAAAAAIPKYRKLYLESKHTDEEKALIAETKVKLDKADEEIEKLKSIMLANDGNALYDFVEEKLYQTIDPVSEDFNKLVHIQLTIAAEEYKAAEKRTKSLVFFVIALSVAALVISITVSSLIIKSILSNVAKGVNAANSLADGDLTQDIHIDGKNEIATLTRSLNNSTNKLNDVVKQSLSISESLAGASQQLSVSADEMNQTSNMQTEKIVQIASALEEVSSTINGIADNTSSMNKKAQETVSAAKEGNIIINKSIAEVEGIASTVESSIALSNSLERNSSKIEEILKVITDISEQTNLLALNAAIEAARAGDAGRGFAVVADEVRKLAEKSTNATLEISGIINTIRAEVKNVVNAMEKISDKVHSGVKLSEETGRSFGVILESLSNLNEELTNIASSIEEVSVTAETIAGDVQSVSAASEESSAASNEVNTASENLAELAVSLQSTMTYFKVR